MGHRTGGVGAIAKAPHTLVQVAALTAGFAELAAAFGCIALYALEVNGGHAITIVVVYGRSGGAQVA